jgi:hypothetical protein
MLVTRFMSELIVAIHRQMKKTDVPTSTTYSTFLFRLMNGISQSLDRWPLAGDQLYIDMDLSGENLPPGTQLTLGNAVIEVTSQPHTGCKKFVA